MDAYPLLLDLAGRRVVVVGGGSVAARRVPALLAAGASVSVVAPSVLPAVAELSGVTVSLRGYEDGDLAGAWLAHACTYDRVVNAAVADEASRLRIRCVRADGGGSARTPAVARSADLVVAVGSAGAPDPGRVQAVRDAIALLLETGELPLRAQRAQRVRTTSATRLLTRSTVADGEPTTP